MIRKWKYFFLGGPIIALLFLFIFPPKKHKGFKQTSRREPQDFVKALYAHKVIKKIKEEKPLLICEKDGKFILIRKPELCENAKVLLKNYNYHYRSIDELDSEATICNKEYKGKISNCFIVEKKEDNVCYAKRTQIEKVMFTLTARIIETYGKFLCEGKGVQPLIE